MDQLSIQRVALVDGNTGTYVPELNVSGTTVTTGTVTLENPYVTVTGTTAVEVVGQPMAVNVSNQPTVGIAGTVSTVLREQPVNINGTVVTTVASGTWPVQITGQPVTVQGTLATTGVSTIQFAEAASDSFSRLRTAEPFTVFQSSMQADAQNYAWDTKTATGGSYYLAGTIAAMELYVSNASGSKAVRQTYASMPYLPGKSMLILMTGVLNASPKTGCVARIGLFDDTADKVGDSGGDGVFVELNGTQPNIVLRSSKTGSQVDTVIPQSSWNVDKMDGTGASGLNLDFSKAQIFVYDLEWLGVGSVRVGFSYADKIYYAHIFNNQNINPGAYMRRATLPLRYGIQNTSATSGASTMRQICCSVLMEGQDGWLGYGRSFSADTGNNPQTANQGVLQPVFAVRAIAGRLRTSFIPTLIGCALTTKQTCFLALYMNGTVSGGSWTAVGGGSGMEYNTTPTSFTGGYKLVSKLSHKDLSEVQFNTVNEAYNNLLVGSSIAGTPQQLIVTLLCVGGNGAAVTACNWLETD